MKHIYQTTREVENRIEFVDAHGQRVSSHDVTITCSAAKYVFHGGKQAFQQRLANLNAEHGEGYALEVTA